MLVEKLKKKKYNTTTTLSLLGTGEFTIHSQTEVKGKYRQNIRTYVLKLFFFLKPCTNPDASGPSSMAAFVTNVLQEKTKTEKRKIKNQVFQNDSFCKPYPSPFCANNRTDAKEAMNATWPNKHIGRAYMLQDAFCKHIFIQAYYIKKLRHKRQNDWICVSTDERFRCLIVE